MVRFRIKSTRTKTVPGMVQEVASLVVVHRHFLSSESNSSHSLLGVTVLVIYFIYCFIIVVIFKTGSWL